MKTTFSVLIKTAFPALLLGSLVFVGAPARAEVKPGDRAIDFDAKGLRGESIKLSSLRGKVVLLDFWASWCEPCKKELPLLAKLAPRLKEKGIEIVAVNIDERRENAEQFLRSQNVNMNVAFDANQSIVKQYQPPKMPSSFVIDRKGVIQAVNEGFEEGDQAKFEKQLSSLATK